MSKATSIYFNAFLFVFIASLCIAGKPQVTYEKYRTEFKHSLFERQQGIMEEAEYKAFVEPYVQEAERTLRIAHYLKDQSVSHWTARYFNYLLNYNVAYFHAYAKTYSGAQEYLEQAEKELADCIGLIALRERLSIDTKVELEKTKALCARLNHRFYKNLGYGIRFLNFFRTLGT